jgi:hypothetical protein
MVSIFLDIVQDERKAVEVSRAVPTSREIPPEEHLREKNSEIFN